MYSPIPHFHCKHDAKVPEAESQVLVLLFVAGGLFKKIHPQSHNRKMLLLFLFLCFLLLYDFVFIPTVGIKCHVCEIVCLFVCFKTHYIRLTRVLSIVGLYDMKLVPVAVPVPYKSIYLERTISTTRCNSVVAIFPPPLRFEFNPRGL